jgi:hypothetical protein
VRALLVSLVMLGACHTSSTALPGGAARNPDASLYQECSTLCLRPGDCAVAYPDDDVCPAGFRCARTFSCRDGG